MWTCPVCGRGFARREQSRFCGEKPRSIDEYIPGQDGEKRNDLILIRDALRRALPGVPEKIARGMPTYRDGRSSIHFAALKKHIGLYPGGDATAHFAEELYSFDRGTIRIPWGKVDTGLIERIARWCLENEGRG